MSTLSLDEVVDVTVAVGPVNAVRTNFNLGLIVGSSAVIDVDKRVKIYQKLDDMKADAWKGTEPEYLAAQIYFSQTPRPSKVTIGRWNKTEGSNETAVQAVTACRSANTEWYACTVCGAEKADITAVANYIESADPASAYFYTTQDSDVKANTDGNIMYTLKKTSIHRTLGQYSTTEDAVVAIMGYAMGANNKSANSAYTLANKSEVGVNTEDLSNTEVTAIKNLNGNVYVNRGSVYNLFENGTMADGTYFDELLNLDMLKNNIQVSIINALKSESKIAQTDDGMDNMLNYLTAPMEEARKIGFIAPGVWNASSILSVKTGDTLSRGYIILADSIANQSQTDREARKAPQIYIPAKLAGAIQHVNIGVYVNR